MFFFTHRSVGEFIRFSRTLNRAQWNLKRDDGYDDAKFLSPFSLRKNTLTYFFHSMLFRTHKYDRKRSGPSMRTRIPSCRRKPPPRGADNSCPRTKRTRRECYRSSRCARSRESTGRETTRIKRKNHRGGFNARASGKTAPRGKRADGIFASPGRRKTTSNTCALRVGRTTT